MKNFWKGSEDAADSLLRQARPEASDELVARARARIEAQQPARRWSRVAFAGALTVFMAGSFASFGGLGYASANAHSVATSVIRVSNVAHGSKLPVRKIQSAADDQYGEQTYTPPAATPKPKPAKVIKVAGISTETPQPASGELPFTGLGLGITAALGLMLLAFGALLRRRESRVK